MNILYVKTSSILCNDIADAFIAVGHNLIYIEVPPQNESLQDTYLKGLLSSIQANNPGIIFSLEFYPFLSLACELLGLPYIAWIMSAYNPNSFNPAIKNHMTHLFLADSFLTRQLQSCGAKNVYHLPAAAAIPRITSTLQQDYNKTDYFCHISLYGTILPRKEVKDHPMTAGSLLKDATRGYLEGCIGCQHQARLFPRMSAKLPDYVWTDLAACYPVDLSNSLESMSQYYDHNYFDPLITYSDREIHFGYFASQERYSVIHHYSQQPAEFSNVTYRNINEYQKQLPLIAANSEINLIIPHRSYEAAVPPSAWEIMGSGGFILSAKMQDYSILPNISELLYVTERELYSKAAYYHAHEKDRIDISSEIKNIIQKEHTYVHRVKELLSLL